MSLTSTASDGAKVTATVGGDGTGTGPVARIYAYIAQVKKDVGRLKTRKAA